MDDGIVGEDVVGVDERDGFLPKEMVLDWRRD